MNILERAVCFATQAHAGQRRKMTGIPYILHPMEVAAIAATLTDDLDTLTACVLHDTMEDCGVTRETLEEQFGERVASLVQSETENKRPDRPAAETWKLRKEESLRDLAQTQDDGVKVLWLSDKLSNMRSLYREHHKKGDVVFQSMHQKDPKMQGWYYQTIASLVSDFSETSAYREYVALVAAVFGGKDK